MRTRMGPRAALAAAAALSAGLAFGMPSAQAGTASVAVADTAPVAVTVNLREGLARVPDTGLGMNDAVWDSQLGTTAVSDLLSGAGIQMLRYPGGSYGDIYHWKDNTAPGGYVAPNTDFDTFMASVQRVGAQPMIIANYGTGTPEEAADWVRYANVTKGYGAKYWTIGNELYGNGHYGANWEADNHADKGPAAYANGVVAFADAMKAVDPSVKIGAVLTMPANWPDGLVGAGDSGTWNRTVLSIAGPKIDFVDLHWYPGGNGAADMLTKPSQVKDAIYVIRQQLAAYAGPNAAGIGISLTETNASVGNNTQPGALYAAETYTEMLQNGVFTVDWWDLHNGPGTPSTVAGQTDYGDGGALSSGTCASGTDICEPPINTPFAPFHAIELLSRFLHTGDQFVGAGTDQPLVSAHAVRRANGDVDVLLANKDPDAAHDVAISYAGFTPSADAPTVYSLTNGASSIARSSTGTATSQTLPPYSLAVLVVHPASAAAGLGTPGAPGQPVASAVTASGATLSWVAAQPGSHPIAKYEIYRQNGAVSEQWGETPGTTFTVGNLDPGTRYTVNVIARDTAGAVSWASPPLTLTTGAPEKSTCTVHFTDANDWGNGYVGGIDITNTGPSPINGWTFTFSWPTAAQTVQSGWNGTWTQNGTAVKVTNADANRLLDAGGGSTSIGFVAGYNAPNILPIAFRLNGTLCSVS